MLLAQYRRFLPQSVRLMSAASGHSGLSNKHEGTLDSTAKRNLDLANFDPNNYDVPLRMVTMNDLMEPYGSWDVAYAAEKKRANWMLARGIASFVGACLFVYYGGVFDGILMPNLDNIMEDTQPFEFEKGEDRITV